MKTCTSEAEAGRDSAGRTNQVSLLSHPGQAPENQRHMCVRACVCVSICACVSVSDAST